MFSRKLKALKHHSPDSVDVRDQTQFRNLVYWLEDQKIRNYQIDQRANLQKIDSPDWPKAFVKYCKDNDCPIESGDQIECLEWLLGHAVKLEYADNFEKYKNFSAEKLVQTSSSAPTVKSANPLDALDFESQAFKDGVNALAKLLNITCHPDHLVTLKAISQFVCQRLRPEVIEKPEQFIVKGKPFPIADIDSGFNEPDHVTNLAAKILRLLYIHDLRDLQTKINECIVSTQSLTANPKTDTKLGKVGR
ncbi:RNA transcription, translation and transport factor protein [Bemisia tabaci]|uniref:RNA transcription, translation and transport factor protein n=1 Tax=Bemisia tabaci TaxID=7038 RepID=UPI0008F9B860|nr:PREDICTED: UPF0568 protein C14orf166 homolog [Bemisia tabaci]